MIYFDTSYLVRLYLPDTGAEQVRELAGKGQVCCWLHGRVEVIAAFHRSLREGRLTRAQFLAVLEQFRAEDEAFGWLAAEPTASRRAEAVYRAAKPTLFLRAADAMHLACAAENGFREIYSHDRHLLAAATLFGLKGRNVIS